MVINSTEVSVSGEPTINLKKSLIASRIDNRLKEKKMNYTALAKQMKRHPSEISKWLTGNHNFTIDTLLEIEQVLELEIFSLGSKVPVKTTIPGNAVLVAGGHVDDLLKDIRLRLPNTLNKERKFFVVSHRPLRYKESDVHVTVAHSKTDGDKPWYPNKILSSFIKQTNKENYELR